MNILIKHTIKIHLNHQIGVYLGYLGTSVVTRGLSSCVRGHLYIERKYDKYHK